MEQLKQPLDRNTQEAIFSVGDAGFEIREKAFQAAQGKITPEEFLAAADEQVTFLTQVLPLLRARLSGEKVSVAEEEQVDPRVSISKFCTGIILVPLIKTTATDHGFAVKEQGGPS